MQNYLTLSVLSILVISCATPKAQFVVSGDAKAPATIQFDNQSTNADTYVWNFGGLGESNEASPSFAFPTAGNYLVSLKAQKGKKEAVYYERVNIEGPEACLVKIETEFGDMIVQLNDATPDHQANFLKLAEEGFYDGLLFHRVMNGFMIQGGDPQSKNAPAGRALGRGGPGYTIPAEFVDSLVHIKGALAAARTPDEVNPKKNSSGSQFYLVHGRKINDRTLNEQESKLGYKYSPANRKAYLENGGAQFLDGEYTVFGQVIEGLEVIDKIAQSRTDSRNRPQKDVMMKMSVINYFIDKKRP